MARVLQVHGRRRQKRIGDKKKMTISERRRFAKMESKLEKVNNQVRNLEKKNVKLVEVKFIGITFDPNSYSDGENQLNDALDNGYKVIKDYPTGAGIVVAMGLYKKEVN